MHVCHVYVYVDVHECMSYTSDRALWGKCAAEILMVNCETALADLTALNEAVNQRVRMHTHIHACMCVMI